MKRKVLCAFALLAWILVACTLLSIRIEEQMPARVVASQNTDRGIKPLPLESVSYDEAGCHAFSVAEGSGWESGLRARELRRDDYSVEDAQVTVTYAPFGSYVVRYASRPLLDGEPLILLPSIVEKKPDIYLLLSETELPELTKLPRSMDLRVRERDLLLLDYADAPQPFLETQGRDTLFNVKELAPYIHPMLADQLRLYSLTAVEQFLENLPRAALMAVLLVFPFFLLLGACRVAGRGEGRRRWLIWADLVLTAADALALRGVLASIDLPPSLLPRQVIFDFGHYARELGRVLDALRQFDADPAVQTLLEASHVFGQRALLILGTGLLLAVLTAAAECLLSRPTRSGTGRIPQ